MNELTSISYTLMNQNFTQASSTDATCIYIINSDNNFNNARGNNKHRENNKNANTKTNNRNFNTKVN